MSETPGLLLRQSVENRKRVTTREHLLLLSPHLRAGMVLQMPSKENCEDLFELFSSVFLLIIYLLTFSRFLAVAALAHRLCYGKGVDRLSC